MKYDIIGDIHGQADKLVALLKALDYRCTNKVWHHPNRQAWFVGDFVDRGPHQVEVLSIVRRMVDGGHARAVMGNHEFNAIAWHTPDPLHPGAYLRKHTEKNHHQHAHFLEQVVAHTPHHRHWVDWFKTLPLWIETDHLRLIHACWHQPSMDVLSPLLGPDNTLTDRLIEASSRKGSCEYEAVEALCKGLEIALPHPMTFTDAQGIERTQTRVRWWDEGAISYQDAALLSPHERSQLPQTPIPPRSRNTYDNQKPVFFGHYWLTGTPEVISDKICCVDYSAAREGHPLVAYQWDGENTLSNDNFIAVCNDIKPVRSLG